MMSSSTETRTYVGLTGTTAFNVYAGLRIGQRYTGVVQDDGAILVSAVGALVEAGVRVSGEERGKWF